MKMIERRGRGDCAAELFREFQHAGSSRGIVIRAVMNLTFLIGIQSAFTAAAKMIVMRADDHGLLF